MKSLSIIVFCTLLLYACHDEKSHPHACFTVENPVMALGDTVKIKLCGNITRDSEWDMGDTIYDSAEIPKHVYADTGTYTIKLKSYEHLSGKMLTHWQKGVTSEAQQTVTVQ
jgi:hypothetical protein